MRFKSCLLISCLLASTVVSAAPRRSKRSKAKKAPPVEVVEEESQEDEEPEVAELDDEEAPIEDADEDDEEGDEEIDEEVAVRKKAKKTQSKSTGEFYFRAGIAHVQPRISSSGMELEPAGIAQLAPMEPVQGSVYAEPTNIFAATLGYAPGVFRGYIGIETIIGLPKKAKLKARGDLATKSLAPDLGFVDAGVPPLGEELGEAYAVPPLVTVVFRAPMLGPFRAYAGGGVSVMFVRDAKVTNKVLTEVATPKLEIDPAVGVVAQIGIEAQIYKRFWARLDFKEMWFQPSETRISNIHVKTTIPLLETINVGNAKSQSTANPILVQFGLGMSF